MSLQFVNISLFEDCTSLKKVILSNKINIIDKYTFNNCSSLEEIVIPEGVEKISYSAFYYCENLKRIVLPSTLKEIDTEAFTGCSSLKEIDTYESVRKVIKDSVNYLYQDHDLEIFYIDDEKKLDPNELIDLVIPEGTTILTKDIVENNKDLKNIKIPSSIKIIDKEAFKDCQFTSIYISEGVETIEDNAFENCQELTKISSL